MSSLHKGEDEWSTICWLNNIPIPSARAVSSVKDLRSGAVLLQLTQFVLHKGKGGDETSPTSRTGMGPPSRRVAEAMRLITVCFGHIPPHLGDVSTSGKCTDSDLMTIVSFLKTVHTTGSPPGQVGNLGQCEDAMPAGALGESPASRSPNPHGHGVNTTAVGSSCASVAESSPIARGNSSSQGGPARAPTPSSGASASAAAAAAAASPDAPTWALGDGRIYQREGRESNPVRGCAEEKRGHGRVNSHKLQEAGRAVEGERGGGRGGGGGGQDKSRNAEAEGDSWGSGNVGRDFSKEGSSFDSSGWPLSRVPSNASNEDGRATCGESERTRGSLELSRAGSGYAPSREPSPEEESLRNLQSTFRPMRLSPISVGMASCSGSDVSPLASELNRRMQLPSMPLPKPVSQGGKAGGEGVFGTGPDQAHASAPGSFVRRRPSLRRGSVGSVGTQNSDAGAGQEHDDNAGNHRNYATGLGMGVVLPGAEGRMQDTTRSSDMERWRKLQTAGSPERGGSFRGSCHSGKGVVGNNSDEYQLVGGGDESCASQVYGALSFSESFSGSEDSSVTFRSRKNRSGPKAIRVRGDEASHRHRSHGGNHEEVVSSRHRRPSKTSGGSRGGRRGVGLHEEYYEDRKLTNAQVEILRWLSRNGLNFCPVDSSLESFELPGQLAVIQALSDGKAICRLVYKLENFKIREGGSGELGAIRRFTRVTNYLRSMHGVECAPPEALAGGNPHALWGLLGILRLIQLQSMEATSRMSQHGDSSGMMGFMRQALTAISQGDEDGYTTADSPQISSKNLRSPGVPGRGMKPYAMWGESHPHPSPNPRLNLFGIDRKLSSDSLTSIAGYTGRSENNGRASWLLRAAPSVVVLLLLLGTVGFAANLAGVGLIVQRRDGVHVMYGIAGRLPPSTDVRVTEGGDNANEKGKSGSVPEGGGVHAKGGKGVGESDVHVVGNVGGASGVWEAGGGGGGGGGDVAQNGDDKRGVGVVGDASTGEGAVKEGFAKEEEGAHNVLNNVVGDSPGGGAAGKEAGGGVDGEEAAIDAGYVAPMNVVIASMTQRGENQAIRELMKVNDRYCSKWGYKRWLQKSTSHGASDSVRQFPRLDVIRRLLAEEGNMWDYVVWLDDDAAVRKLDLQVPQVFELMSSGGDIIVSADKYGFVGAGIIAIRNTDFSRAFIERMYSERHCALKHNEESACLNYCVHNPDESVTDRKDDSNQNKIAVVPAGQFNCHDSIKTFAGECDPWVQHFAGSRSYNDMFLWASAVLRNDMKK